MITNTDILAHYVAKSKEPIYLREDANWENLETGPPSKNSFKNSFAYACPSSCAMQYEGLNFGFTPLWRGTPPQRARKPLSIL